MRGKVHRNNFLPVLPRNRLEQVNTLDIFNVEDGDWVSGIHNNRHFGPGRSGNGDGGAVRTLKNPRF